MGSWICNDSVTLVLAQILAANGTSLGEVSFPVARHAFMPLHQSTNAHFYSVVDKFFVVM